MIYYENCVVVDNVNLKCFLHAKIRSATSLSLMVAVNNQKYYSVVLFDDTKESAAVPFVWLFVNQLDSQTYCYCPTSMSASQFNRAVIDCTPPDDSWDIFQCCQLYATGLLLILY